MAAVLDLARRKIVGWALGNRPTAELAAKALNIAILLERPPKGLMHHSDMGSQYTAKKYKDIKDILLARLLLQISKIIKA